MYVCIYIYIYMYIHICLCMYVGQNVICLHVYIYTCVCIYIYMYMITKQQDKIYIYICVYIYIYVYIYIERKRERVIYIYIYGYLSLSLYIHIYIYIYISDSGHKGSCLTLKLRPDVSHRVEQSSQSIWCASARCGGAAFVGAGGSSRLEGVAFDTGGCFGGVLDEAGCAEVFTAVSGATGAKAAATHRSKENEAKYGQLYITEIHV